MTKTFVTGTGKAIEIGRELGKGNEASVFEVLANHHSAAKLYNAKHQPDVPKQAKLRFMAMIADMELLRYTAWPQETMHKTANGPVVGFLMPKITGRELHEIYSPAHRRQDYPNVGWDFLLYVARNMAAAFAALHRHGHLIGDVNQKNFLFGKDSKVVLVDCDSYQINAQGAHYQCEVGTLEFTPPELQGAQSFSQLIRTENHDNFGLALLIFHLLFGGRHPYSGVPLRNDVGEALEKDIQAFRYAYAPDGQRRGFKPPPKSIPIAIVPAPIQAMFTLAFTENGAKGSRPTAQQWVTALDGLRGQLKRCAATPMHIYPSHLGRCPWCSLEDHGIIYFLDVQIGITSTGTTGFVLARVWAAIEVVPPPPAISIPNIAAIAVKPIPLPPGITQKGTITFWRIAIVGITFWLLTVIPSVWFFVLGGTCWAWVVVGDLGGNQRKAERTKRQEALYTAQQAYDQIVGQIRQEVSPEAFAKKKQDLARLRDEYQQLPEREKTEIANLHATAEARQKHQFLERHFLDAATISGIGPAKKAALRSFGIETAADVTWNKVISVKGFGEVLTRAVVDWQKACERRFVFNPKLAITETDKNAVRTKIAARKRTIEITFNAGAAELQRVRQEMVNKGNTLMPQLQAVCRKLAQAQVDINII